MLNVEKTNCVIFRSRGKRIPNNVDLLEVGEHSVARSEHVKFLGVINIIDEYTIMPVCNQTWLVDALCWPPQYSGVKGHVSRSKVNVKVYLQDSIMIDNFPTICLIVTKLVW